MLNRPHIFANVLDAAVARGTMSPTDAESHPERESLTSFIGAESLDEVDRNLEPYPIAEGDLVLLASDGLFKTLSQDEMLACFDGEPQSWPEALVARTIAKKREHQDNVTVLSIAAEPESAAVAGSQARSQTARRPASVVPAPEFAGAQPTPAFAPQVQAPPTRSRSRMPIVLLIVFLILAAGGWAYLHYGRASKLIAIPTASDSGSVVSAPPSATHAPIQVDPDAPLARPSPVQTSPPEGKPPQ
jgi:hypothetical protein